MIGITSFSQQGYELYGKKMLESSKHFPVDIVAYIESDINDEYETVTYKPLLEVEGINAFLFYCGRNPIFSGQTPNGYDYNRDAAKFCRKVFAQFDALKNHKGKVFWLDGDVEFKKPIPESFLNDLFQGKALVYLGREGFHTESGFVGFDTEHPDFQKFFDKYMECYRKGIIFKLRRWHDCEAFDWAMSESRVEGNNLSSFFKIPENKKMTLEDLDVVNRSVLGEYMTHLKGGRKYH